jgi:hypothetical protein
MTRKDWARHRIRVNIFNVFKSSPFKSSRQRQFFTLFQPPESYLINNNVDMSDIGRGDADSPYV